MQRSGSEIKTRSCSAAVARKYGEPDRIRTCDPLIKSQLLYLLSYGPTCSALPRQRSVHLGSGRALVKRPLHWARLSPLIGSRQSGAIALAGPSTKVRRANSRWGTTSPDDRHAPPLHKIISRSSTRSAQRCAPRRPNSRSIRLSAASNDGGASSLSITNAALAKRRRAGPSGAVCAILERADTVPSAAISSIAARTIPCGGP